MLDTDSKSKINLLWDKFFSGGISNIAGNRANVLPYLHEKAQR
jgi:hypothetical protein